MTTTEIAPAKMAEFKSQIAKLMPKVAAAVPDHIRPNQIVRTLFNTIEANPYILQKCTPISIGKCLIRAATYGLEISSGQLGHCYIVPYGSEAQLQLSYKGIKELVRRSGQGMLFMDVVHEGDEFRDCGQDEKPVHVKTDDPDRYSKPVTHAYAFMRFTNGFVVSRVMSRAACIAHRNNYSQNWKRSQKADNPWHEKNAAFGKMCAKTCVHALANDGDIPLSADLREAMQSVGFGASDIIDAKAIEQIDVVPNHGSLGAAADAAITVRPDDPPAEVDWSFFTQEIDKVMTPLALDQFRKDWIDTHPHQKQEIWDRCEEHRELINNA